MIDFTVLMPVFNTRPAALLEAIDSLENQSIKQSFNVVIIDDGSTSESTLKALKMLNSNKRIKIYTEAENKGTSVALNKGHRIIESEYIALMGSDDISHQERFLLQVKALEKNPVDVLGSNLFSFKDGDITRTPLFTSNHPAKPTSGNTTGGWLVNHGTVFYKNESVKAVNGYDISKRRAQDVDLWPRMEKRGFTFSNLPHVLYGWRRY